MVRRRVLNKAAVICAAAKLADEGGFEQLTLAMVAEQLGIRVPSLYNYVEGLAGLRRALALAGSLASADALRRAAVGKAGDEAVLSLARGYRAFAHAHPGLYTASVRAPAENDAEMQAAGNEAVAVVLAVLEPYKLAPQTAIHMVRGLRSLIHGFVTLEAAGAFGLPLDLDVSFEHLVGAFVVGLR